MLTPGIKTTEFWGRLLASLVGLGVGTGVIQPEIGTRIEEAGLAVIPLIKVVIEGAVQIIGLIGGLWLQYQQGKERVDLKKAQIAATGTCTED